jgi:hypothetical protein
MSSISDYKARRMRSEKSRRWVYVITIIAFVSMFSIGIAYGLTFRGNNGGPTTSGSTTISGTSTTIDGTSTTGYSTGGQHGTAVTLVCNPSVQMVKVNSSCTATVTNSPASAQEPTPTGTISFGSSPAGEFQAESCAQSGGSLLCSVKYAPSLGSEGSIGLTATYPGDTIHSGSSGTFSLHATKRPAAVAVSCLPLQVPVNVKAGCTAKVSDSGGGIQALPSGDVLFIANQYGSFSPSGCALNHGFCSVAFTPAPGNEGIIPISAAYGGDQDHTSGSGSNPDSLAAAKRSSESTIVCNPAQVVNGGQSICTATVADATTAGTPIPPSGTFTFASSIKGVTFNPPSCSLTQSSKNASACLTQFTPASGALAQQGVSGSYSGDGDHTTSSAPSFTVTSKARGSATSLTCSASSVQVGAPISCSVLVVDTGQGTPINPVGKITLSSNSSGTFFPSPCYLSSEKCAFSYTPASGSEGINLITASYGGDSNHASSSAFGTVAVLQRPSSLTITCSPSTLPVGVTTNCSAVVSDQGVSTGQTVPQGTVEFFASGGSFSPATSCQLLGGSCSVNFTPAGGSEGSIGVSGNYLGDADHSPRSAAPYTIIATQRTVDISLSCSPSSVLGSQTSTCTVTVTDTSPGSPLDPTGTVTFSDNAGGSFVPVSCNLSGGSCTVTYNSPLVVVPTTVTITATYSGDTDHAGGSASTTIQVT